MMVSRRARRWARRVGATLLVATVAVAAGFAPRALRDVEAFRVQRVEVLGTRYLEPYTVVRAAGFTRASSVFDDRQAWRSGILTLPLVEGVRVHRKLPSTVTVEVWEVEPVALVSGASLRPVDRRGRVLEIDPAGTVLDLPIVTGAPVRGGRVGDGGAAALGVLVALRAGASELADQVSQVEVRPAALRLVFRDGRTEALLPIRPSETQLAQLHLAYADLTARGELGKVSRIDVRFRDQVVVSFLDTPVS